MNDSLKNFDYTEADRLSSYLIFTQEENDILRKNLDYNHIFFVNIREAKGIESFSQLVMEHGLQKPTKVLIESKKDTNEVDSVIYEIKSVEYDKIYQNNGTLEELSEKAQEFVKGIIYGKY